jgi:hypothetical protein
MAARLVAGARLRNWRKLHISGDEGAAATLFCRGLCLYILPELVALVVGTGKIGNSLRGFHSGGVSQLFNANTTTTINL